MRRFSIPDSRFPILDSRLSAAAIAILALLILAPELDAHLMPEGQGSTRIVGDKAYTLISVPVTLLRGFDDDRNGAISDAEARAHADTLHAQIERRVQLIADGVVGTTVYRDLQVPHFDSSASVQSAAVIQIRVSQWVKAPKAVRLHADVFTSRDKELYFRTIIGDSTEAATLTARRPDYNFFMGPDANPEPVAAMLAPSTFVLLGVAAAFAAAALRMRRQRQNVSSNLSSAA